MSIIFSISKMAVGQTIPKVTVPMDFGRENIGSPTHDNLVLKLKDKVELKANSLIFSFNSPVIAHLTLVLHQTFLDMDDFSEDAVNCFIDAAYSGEMVKISKENFRDVNKMVHVFDVAWMVEGCLEFFKGMVASLSGDDCDEISLVLEEAEYFFTTMKDCEFQDLAIEKIETFTVKQRSDSVMARYAYRMGDLTDNELDNLIEIAGDDTSIIAKLLREYLPKLSSGLDDNTRYILQNMDLVEDSEEFEAVMEDIFDCVQAVQGISLVDMRMVFTSLYKKKCAVYEKERLEQSNPARSSGTLVWTPTLNEVNNIALGESLCSPPTSIRNLSW